MDIPSWRASPFIVGHRYRVRRNFRALRDVFKAGEILVYRRAAWSRYHGYTGHFFTSADHGREHVWDVVDEENADRWGELFAEVPPGLPGDQPAGADVTG